MIGGVVYDAAAVPPCIIDSNAAPGFSPASRDAFSACDLSAAPAAATALHNVTLGPVLVCVL